VETCATANTIELTALTTPATPFGKTGWWWSALNRRTGNHCLDITSHASNAQVSNGWWRSGTNRTRFKVDAGASHCRGELFRHQPANLQPVVAIGWAGVTFLTPQVQVPERPL
jgi:hypothetical protein